jgi:hypothetical protein
MDGNGLVNGANARPKQPHGELRVEVESSRRFDRFHNSDGGPERINPKSEKRIPHPTPQRFEVGKPVADTASLHSFRRSIGPKNRNAQDHCVRMIHGSLHKSDHVIGWMLSIRIDEESVGIACLERRSHCDQRRTAFAPILLQKKEA